MMYLLFKMIKIMDFLMTKPIRIKNKRRNQATLSDAAHLETVITLKIQYRKPKMRKKKIKMEDYFPGMIFTLKGTNTTNLFKISYKSKVLVKN